MTVLVVAEHRRGELRAVSLELLTAGRQLADETGSALHAAVVGGDVDRFGQRLDRDGVDVVHTVDEGEEFNHDVYAQAITQLVRKTDSAHVLAPHTANGVDYVPALASRLDRPLVTDVVALSGADGLTVTRERYGSKVEETVAVDSGTAVVTIRPGEWPAAGGTGDATVAPFAADIDDDAVRSQVVGFEEVGGGDIDVTDADIVLAVGRGIEDEANLPLIFELADALGATVAGSGPVVKNGWLPPDRQIGQTGAVVSPDIYLAIGISGAPQHVAGMRESETIVAVNSDPTAPIFDVADFGIVADLFEVVPELVDAFHG